MPYEASFSGVTIVESVDRGRAGRRLADDIGALIAASGHSLSVEYRPVYDRKEFVSELTSLAERARAGSRPMLHLECHGSVDGIQLESGEQINWADLTPLLIDINVATRCNLLVVMAACYGANLVATLSPEGRAPCWGFFGPPEEVKLGELSVAYGDFYRTAIFEGDPLAAAKKLIEPREGKQRYMLMLASVYFTQLFARYLAHYCTDAKLLERAKELSHRARAENAPQKPGPGRMHRMIRRKHPKSFRKIATEYFMVDLFPENANRFPVSYEEALSEAEGIAGRTLNVARA